MERDGLVCQICGCDVVRRGLSPEADTLHLDHIIPYSHGGTDTEDNLRVSCAACNWARGNRMEKS